MTKEKNMPRVAVRFIVPSILIAACVVPASAGAVTIAPDVFNDELNADGDCSLREAVQATNTNATVSGCVHDGDTVEDTIQLDNGAYVLDISGPGELSNLTGDLNLDPGSGTAGLLIEGEGVGVTTIDTDDSPAWDDRVINRGGGSGLLTMSDLTVTGGNSAASSGGGIRNVAGDLFLTRVRVTGNTGGDGGGLLAGGDSVEILETTFDENTATGLSGGGGIMAAAPMEVDRSAIVDNTSTHPTTAQGGGIRAGAALEIVDSAIIDNHVIDPGAVNVPRGGGINLAGASAEISGTAIVGNDVTGGAVRRGGGVASSGDVTIVNSTFSGNEALGAGGDGGGFHNDADATIFHTTFGPNPTGNSAGTAILHNGTSLAIVGSVVEGTGTGTSCLGSLTSGGHNVFTDTSCGTPSTGDETDADPMLGSLADLGGTDAGAPGFTQPRLAHAPAAASTVVDHVPVADCDGEAAAPLTLDQLANTRPKDGDDPDTVADCEAGAIEISATPVTPPATGGGGGGTTTPTPTPKKCKKGQKLKKGKCVKKKRKKR